MVFIMNKTILMLSAVMSVVAVSAADIYVSLATGKNKNAGTKEALHRYQLEDALKLFGAIDGKGAQVIK